MLTHLLNINMASKIFRALYNDDDILMNAVKKVRCEHYHIEEVFTPFPVHGLDKAMGLEETRLSMTAFLYGVLGLTVAVTMMNYIMIEDWPQDIGGKPSFSLLQNLPAFVPVMFEMTVFFAAHLMVITFYLRSRMWPFKKAENPLPRTTSDVFLMEVVATSGKEDELTELLLDTGAIEVQVPKA